jgi:heavy metal translocating P-type ATPase
LLDAGRQARMRVRWAQIKSALAGYSLLAATVAVGLTVLALVVSDAGGPARATASAFALAVAAWKFTEMVREIVHGQWGIDLLAVTAIVATVAVGEYGAALIIVLMLTGGESLENYAAGRATRELRSLLDRAPRFAHRLHGGDGRVEDVEVDEVAVGDVLLLRPAEVVPVDGVLVSAVADFDESSLTGESLPVERRCGQAVLSGAVNGQRAVRIRATARAVDSQYSQIVELVREASASRAPVVRLADRYAVPFTALAYLIAGGSWFASADAARFAEVLVVATPCPLLIAAPVAFLGGMSRAARRGVIVRGGAVLEVLARVRTAAFDKTGTLTHGRPGLTGVHPARGFDEPRLLMLAASAEQYSSHVLAASIIQAARERGLSLQPAESAREDATNGVSALIGAHQVVVGKRSYVADRSGDIAEVNLGPGQLAVYVAVDGAFAGSLVLRDPVRENAAATLGRLAGLGVRHVLMLTGDAEATARHVGAELGIPDVRAECLPADKVSAVRTHPARPVLMVGDGVNDAPVLAAADVGVAMGARGSTAASESADVVVMLDDLGRIADAVAIGQRTVQVAVQSIWLGIGLSVALMVLAAFGFVPAIGGALAQEAVDLATIGNALRALTGEQRVQRRIHGARTDALEHA